jgi:hypothetical protein
MDNFESIQAEIGSCLLAAANVAGVTDPFDTHGMVELMGQLKQLDQPLQSSGNRGASEVCAVGMKIAERLIDKVSPSPQEMLLWVHLLLKSLGTTAGVAVPEPPTAALPPPSPFRIPGADGGQLRVAKPDGLRLGEILVEMSYLTAEDVRRALAMQQDTGCRLGEALVKLGLLTQKGLEAVLRVQQRRRAPRR